MEGAPTPAGNQLTEFETLMWHLERHPQLSSNIANLTILDRAPDRDAFTATMERASLVFPRLRQRIVEGPGPFSTPRWEPDPDFDITRHVTHLKLRRPSRAALHELAVQRALTPFDRSRPLWEFLIIEGLAGGKAAMLQRLHHTLTDGEGGLRLSLEFIDFTRDAPARPPVEVPPAPHTNWWSSMGESLERAARQQLDFARRTVDEVAHAVTHPTSVVETGAELVELARSTARQASVGVRPMSPLWTQRSLGRSFDTFDVPLAPAKAAATALGGTLNDLFVCGAAAGAGRYHDEMHAPADRLRMAMPISRRADKSLGGNVFSPTQTAVPTAPMTVEERFRRVHDVLAVAKGEPPVGSNDLLAGFINLVPTPVLTRAGVRIAGVLDFVTSNLRAAPMDVFMAGALVESNYPLGPVAGTAFNLTTMSYRGSLCMGVVIDTAAITEPKRLVRCLQRSFADLLRAGGQPGEPDVSSR